MIRVSKCAVACCRAGIPALFLAAGLLAPGVSGAIPPEKQTSEGKKDKPAKAASAEDAVKRGAPIGDSPAVTLAEVVKDPEAFVDRSVIVVGTVAEVCQTKGCWMRVLPEGSETGVRVTFLDYGFFVPKDSQGMSVRAEGTFHTKVLSKEDADHLEGEGAKLVRNPDGTVTELGFVASGVELVRKPESKTKKDSDEKKSSTPE
jgi:hypothetical protein